MVTVVRGDVILCDLNPVVGTEQAVARPPALLSSMWLGGLRTR